jgi:hypothetical protein
LVATTWVAIQHWRTTKVVCCKWNVSTRPFESGLVGIADEVLDVLNQARIPAGKIYDIGDIASDPHYQARDMLLDAELDDGTPVKLQGFSQVEQDAGQRGKSCAAPGAAH